MTFEAGPEWREHFSRTELDDVTHMSDDELVARLAAERIGLQTLYDEQAGVEQRIRTAELRRDLYQTALDQHSN